MKKTSVPSCGLLFVLKLAVFGGCQNASSTNDQAIARMIKDGLSTRDKTLKSSGGIFSDYKVYRDGKKDGIVYEAIYATGVVVDRFALSSPSTKQTLINKFSKDPVMKRDMAQAIHVRVLYKTFSGQVIYDTTITSEDLN